MIVVIATIQTKSGSRKPLLDVIRELVPKVRAEKGCIEYGPMIDVETDLTGKPPRENVVTMVEKWENVAALEAHLVTPHMHEFRKATELMRLDLKLQVLAPGL